MDVRAAIVTAKGGHRVLLTLDGNAYETPPLEHLAFYVGLGMLVQAEFLELPVALALGVGHALRDLTRRPALAELGEALVEA